jgi:hypothetical protein
MSDVATRLASALADRYRVEREIGAGGMATVYLAHDIKHDRDVALKVLKPELAAVLGAERFVVEIKTTAALQHPHILPLFDSGTADIENSQWLSPTELTMTVWNPMPAMDRIHLDLTGPTPIVQRRRWLALPEFITTAGQSYTLARDGRVVYVRGSPERPVQYLHVVPNWVAHMKRAVDEANRR